MTLRITGTFIDEVTHDIPGHNWGPVEWAQEFETFSDVGIDTVVLIRAGYGERLSFPSRTVAQAVKTLPVYADVVELLMKLSDEHGIDFYVGLYDSGYHWLRYDWRSEVAINRGFARELFERYGQHRSFKGWYLPHETPDSSRRIIDLNRSLAEIVRAVADRPVLVSPYWAGRPDDVPPAGRRPPAISVDEHASQWDEILGAYSGLVDYCAFQDGTAYEHDLEDLLRASEQVAKDHRIELWTNVESFDRDMPIRFLPIEWRKLLNKLDTAEPYVTKAITFEFSHFLSPNSMWPSARALFRRYQEYCSGELGRL